MGGFILSDNNGAIVFRKLGGTISKPTQYGKTYPPELLDSYANLKKLDNDSHSTFLKIS